MSMPVSRVVDATDARILLALDDDPLATTVALARQLGLARNTVQARLRSLERLPGLNPPSSRVRPAALGRPIVAFVSMVISQGDLESIAGQLALVPEIVELHAVTGDYDILAKVIARDPIDLHRVTRQLLEIPSVERTSTAMAAVELVPPRGAPLLRAIALAATQREV